MTVINVFLEFQLFLHYRSGSAPSLADKRSSDPAATQLTEIDGQGSIIDAHHEESSSKDEGTDQDDSK
jgi:hypothetical protein